MTAVKIMNWASLVVGLGWMLSGVKACGQGAVPLETGVQSRRSDRWIKLIDQAVETAIERKQMPGAVVCIGDQERIHLLKAYGNRALMPETEKMTTDTVFDLASLTKPIATATSVMILLEEGRIRLRDPVFRYIPGFASNGKRSITVEQLLTHVGGLTPDNALSDYQDGRQKAFQRINELKPVWEPGSRFAYSDVGFIVLGELVEKTSGMTLDRFAHERIFAPLEMKETGFNPSNQLRVRCAVTQKRNGKWIRGKVHDPRAFELGGVAGHAGLFSTAKDLSRYCRMFLQGGQLQGNRVLAPVTIYKMTRSKELPGQIKRGLGWDKLSPYSSNRGELMTDQAFGHGGFTGTAVWIDPGLNLFVIFLSNRVHPDGKGSVNRLAGRIGTISAAEFSRRFADR